jgi:SAM-dependent methyltransferase
MDGQNSNYIDNNQYLSDLVHEKELAFRETASHISTEFGSEEAWLRAVDEVFPKFVPYLIDVCGVRFRGRILEIGAGACWFSAELSKLSEVQEVVATDFSPHLLKIMAPRIFERRQAETRKITRMPADFHKMTFPEQSFDFVVCSAVIHHAVDVGRLLREVHRVLKNSGQFIAIREPVWPLVRLQSRSKTQERLVKAGVNEHMYTLPEYKKFFADAGFDLSVKSVNLATGWKYWFNMLVNGLTHARYAFVATKQENHDKS